MIQDLEIYRKRIALEASLDVANMGAVFNKVFPSIQTSFANWARTLGVKTGATINPTRKQAEFMRELMKHQYLNLAPLAAYVPEGLNVTYLKYAEALQPAVEHASKVLGGSLNEFTGYVSELLTNADGVLSTRSIKRQFQAWEVQRERLNHDLGRCFNSGTRSEVTYERVVDRNGDWAKLFPVVDAMVKTMNTISHAQLSKKIDECVALIQSVKTKGERGEMENITAQVLDNLAEGAYTCAREVEFYSAVYYKVDALSNCIDQTLAHFEKVQKSY